MSLQDTYNSQQDFQNSLLETFMSHVNPVIAKALLRLTSYLKGELTLKGNKIEQTAHNLNILRNLDKQYLKYLNQEGYQGILNAFVNQFPGGLPHLKDILEELSAVGNFTLPVIKFSAEDLKVFSGFQVSTKQALQDVMNHAAERARQQISFSIGSIKFNDLTDFLQDRLAVGERYVKNIADTSLNIYQRQITAASFDFLEQELKDRKLTFAFHNPLDSKTRVWCREMVARTRNHGLTREEINGYPNGQIPNPFTSGGGWNCRGTFTLHVGDLAKTVVPKTMKA